MLTLRGEIFFSTRMKEGLCATIEGFIFSGSLTVRVDSFFPLYLQKHLLESLSSQELYSHVAIPQLIEWGRKGRKQ